MQLRPIFSEEFGRDVRLAAARAKLTTTEYLHKVVHPLVTLEDGVPLTRT